MGEGRDIDIGGRGDAGAIILVVDVGNEADWSVVIIKEEISSMRACPFYHQKYLFIFSKSVGKAFSIEHCRPRFRTYFLFIIFSRGKKVLNSTLWTSIP